MHARFGWGKYEGKRPSGDMDVGGRIMLKWILKRNREGCELDSSGSGQVDGNEPSGS